MNNSKHPDPDELDEAIFSNRKLEAVRILQEREGLGIATAIEALSARYRKLRSEFPERFTCNDAEYWKDFHS